MSNALNQSRRANTRESTASSGSAGGGGEDVDAVQYPFCFDLSVTEEEIRSEFGKAAIIGKITDKVKIVKSIIKGKTTIRNLITTTQGKDAFSAVFSNRGISIVGDIKGDTAKVPSISAILCEICPILESNSIYTNDTMHRISDSELVQHLISLRTGYDRAKGNVEESKLNVLTKKMVKLVGPSRDRKFLENGTLPEDNAHKECVCCGHKNCVDEPISNQRVVEANQRKRANHEAQAARDQIEWDAGRPVLNNNGTVLQIGRARPFPKLDLLSQECHCEQQNCLTKTGEVSEKDCIIKCINPETKMRYEFVNGECQCPHCMCKCRKAWSVS